MLAAAAAVEVGAQPCQRGAEEDVRGEETLSESGGRCDGAMVGAASEGMDLNLVDVTGAEATAGVSGLDCLKNWPTAGPANGATGTSVAAEGSWDCYAEQETLLLSVAVAGGAFAAKFAEAWLWVATQLEGPASAAGGDHHLPDLRRHQTTLP